jgi:hypothetical protein
MKRTLSLLLILLLSNITIAQTTSIPDANFEQALITLGYDNGSPDGIVLTANIDTITSLNISIKNISDLTGIEDFSGLTNLDCWSNSLTSIDITQNLALNKLNCSGNQLTSIDLTHNASLTEIRCGFNQLSGLNVSQNMNLTFLSCAFNMISNLNTTNNTGLTDIICHDNQIVDLDLSQNVQLTYLVCYKNQLTSLNVSPNTALNTLSCKENLLTCLNVKNGNNANFTVFAAQNNPNLTCVSVDNVIFSTTNWSNIDAQTSFSTNCASSCAVGIDKHNFSNLSLFPNPTTGSFTIDLGKINQKVKATLTNSLGQVLFSMNYSSTKFINLDIGAPKGIYFLRLEIDGEVITKKIIKG